MAAAGLSVAAHIFAFFAFFSSLSGGLISAPQMEAGGGVAAFYVTLSPADSASSVDGSGGAVAALFAKLHVTPAADGLFASDESHDQFHALADRLKAGANATTGGRSRDRSQRSAAQEQAGQSAGSDAQSMDGQTADAISTGQFWGRIEPCWQNLGLRPRVSVRLEVRLDNLGQIRTPPRVLRSDTAVLDEPRLKAEDSALAAVAACLPRGDPTFAGKAYIIEFPRT